MVMKVLVTKVISQRPYGVHVQLRTTIADVYRGRPLPFQPPFHPVPQLPPPQPVNCAPSTKLPSRYSNIFSSPRGPRAQMRNVFTTPRAGSTPNVLLPIRKNVYAPR